MSSAQLVVDDSEAMMLGICGLPAESLQDMCQKKSCVAHTKQQYMCLCVIGFVAR
jgi:hypothetical protein